MTPTAKTAPGNGTQRSESPTSPEQTGEKGPRAKTHGKPRATTLSTFAARADKPRKRGTKSPLAALIAKAAGQIDDNGRDPSTDPGDSGK